MQPTWIITGFRASPRGQVWTPSQSFSTKRKAVQAMNNNRKPKTLITKVGHSYVYQAVDETAKEGS